MNKIASIVSLLAIGLFFAFMFCSCNKDPEIITNTIIETDTLIITQQDTATTFIVVRHAETEALGMDPELSAVGIERTGALRKALENISLTAVYSTDFNRTVQTAQPIATDQSLIVENYDPLDLDSFVDSVLEDHLADAILVVGHSNTTPDLLNILVGNSTYSHLPATEYDNLYLVTVFEKGRAEVTHLKYGE